MSDCLDGFASGPSELAFRFRKAGHELAWYQPLLIFESPSATTRPLATTERRAGEHIVLRMNGSVVDATYHDGMWQPASPGPGLEWATGSAHSLTFNYSGLRFGIRGGRGTGVTREELVRVAESLA